jgi:endonuclease G, mitochondrial
MNKEQKLAARQELKRSLMLEAAERWQETSDTGFKPTESGERAVNVTRVKNHTLRETLRSQKGMTELFDELFRREEAQIDTWDAVNQPPHAKAALAGKPVARIVNANADGPLKGFGSGFLISDSLFMTNHHVFPDIDYAEECQANFNYEYNAANVLQEGSLFNLEPGRFFINDRKLDFAIVAIAPKSIDGLTTVADLGCIQLIETPGKIIKGDDINIIQYPLGGHKQYACRQNQVTQIFEEKGYIQYITDTARAASGSPCFNRFWELAALHHCAIPKVVNKEIIDINGQPWDGRDEDMVLWVSNEGISISKIIAFLKAGHFSSPTNNLSLLASLLGTVYDPLLEAGPRQPAKAAIPLVNDNKIENNMPAYTFNFYGPTTVNVGVLPAAAVAPIEPVTPALPEAVVKLPGEETGAIKFDEDYDGREDLGYKEDFLEGYILSEPKVTDPEKLKELYRENVDPVILKYYNYSLVMNKKRRFCHWTAVNTNYDPEMRTKKARKDFGADTWRRDPRVPDQSQVIGKELYNPAKRVEQGHIVRRDDSCWGEDAKSIEFANSDTFHYTNCTPQLEPFNRENPRAEKGYGGIHGIWGGLEEHIKKELKNIDNKAIIYAGPYLSNADPVIEYTEGQKIKTPMKFWKVVCVRDSAGKLFSYGFWLDQKDVWDQFGPGLEAGEALDFLKFKKQQIRINEITKKTKVEFDSEVYKTDVLKNNQFSEGAETAISYNDVKDIQLLPKNDQS